MFDVNSLIGLIVIVGIILVCYTNIEHLTNEVTYVKSTIDGQDYLVRNAPNKEEAANILSRTKTALLNLTEHMNKKYVEGDDYKEESDNDKGSNDKLSIREAVKRLVKKFNPNNISESGASNKYTSYSVNKGEKIIFCLRQKDENQSFVDENVIRFVAIHELAHIMTLSVGHEPEFWNNFRVLLQEALALGIYKKEDYSKSPKPYCGITVSDSPLYNK
jgi:predicted metal-dependent hydrolase